MDTKIEMEVGGRKLRYEESDSIFGPDGVAWVDGAVVSGTKYAWGGPPDAELGPGAPWLRLTSRDYACTDGCCSVRSYYRLVE